MTDRSLSVLMHRKAICPWHSVFCYLFVSNSFTTAAEDNLWLTVTILSVHNSFRSFSVDWVNFIYFLFVHDYLSLLCVTSNLHCTFYIPLYFQLLDSKLLFISGEIIFSGLIIRFWTFINSYSWLSCFSCWSLHNVFPLV